MLKTGIYGEEYRSLNRHVPVEHTWANFKSHFKLTYTSLRETQLATGRSIYHGTNTTIHHEYSEVIITLATNTSKQHTLVANIVQTNTTILD